MKMIMIKPIFSLFAIALLWACNGSSGKQGHKPDSTVPVTDAAAQTSAFNSLVSLTEKAIPQDRLNDSLAFLVLPVKLSCPACRKKTIDSIVKHQYDLPERHYIIISGSEGRRNMNSYFREVDKQMPVMENQLFLDTINQAYKKELVSENPVIYYTANQKAYKKVSAIPATVRDNLREFFSGARNNDFTKQ
jgi:hypothetical protein